MTSDSDAFETGGFEWKRFMFLMIGVTLFTVVYYAPPWADAVDPQGKTLFVLSREGKGALAIFCWPAPGGF